MATDDSVLANLQDLFQMEAQRRAEEAAAEARARAEASERAARERIEREAEIARVRAEARSQAEAERQRGARVLEARVVALREELDRERAERERVHLAVAELSARAAKSPRPRRAYWLGSGLAVASLAAALIATYTASQRPTPVLGIVETADSSPSSAETATPTEVVEAVPAVPAPALSEPVSTPVPEVSPRPRRPRPTVRPRPRPRPRSTPSAADDLSRQLDFDSSNQVLTDDFLRQDH